MIDLAPSDDRGPAAAYTVGRCTTGGSGLALNLERARLAGPMSSRHSAVAAFGGDEDDMAGTASMSLHSSAFPMRRVQRSSSAPASSAAPEMDMLATRASRTSRRTVTSGVSHMPSLSYIDDRPPSESVVFQLDSVLRSQFGAEEDTKQGKESDEQEPMGSCMARMSRIVNQPYFVIFFMACTFYALVVPDLDRLLGSRESKFTISIITSAVCLLFVAEILLQSLGKKKYACRAYFWLDVIALMSLLPDTYFVQMATTNALVAGRTSRLMRLLRITARSSQATRLNRLSRIARVASLMPRLNNTFGRLVKEDETDKLLSKKLRRVFTFLDEDMDGSLPCNTCKLVIARMKEKIRTVSSSPNLFKVASKMSTFVQKTSGCSKNSTASKPVTPQIQEATQPEEADCLAEPRHGESEKPLSSPKVLFKTLLIASTWGRMTGSCRSLKFKVEEEEEEDEKAPNELMHFEDFFGLVLQDAPVAGRLRRICGQELKRSTNMKNLTAWHSEYVAVKVAIAVLFSLAVLNLVEPAVKDYSAERGLKFSNELIDAQFPSISEHAEIPELVHDQVSVWTHALGDQIDGRAVVYLDIGKRVYCNELGRQSQQGCDSPARFQGLRPSLEAIDDFIAESDFRVVDLRRVLIPDLSGVDVSAAELNEQTISVAVLYARESTQWEAGMSLATTLMVSVIILTSMYVLTHDFTHLSRNVLVPMRELAYDMDSIESLQLAGISIKEETITKECICEVRLIRSKFENMKTALRSWGKYVPWPVVQLLLRTNSEAALQVAEKEVTIFFSDIVSFTSIVEALRPEETLLLLSRYFNDMSKIVDDHGGIVMEFIGDAILAIFGTPLVNPDHATAAVDAARRMHCALKRLNHWGAQQGFPHVKLRCGIHTGKVLVGNMGMQERMKYGIVGEESHIPPNLETLNKTYGTNTLISQSTFTRLRRDYFVSRPIDYVHLTEAPDAVSEPIYEIMPATKKDFAEAAAMHSEAMAYYRDQDFGAAQTLFSIVCQKLQDATQAEDVPSQLMVARCAAYLQKPPGPDWDGIWGGGSQPHEL